MVFSRIRGLKKRQSVFNLSHINLLSGEMGKLYPFFWTEVAPGDKMKVDAKYLLRLMPQLSPFMANVKVSINYFFVPYRQLWNKWEEFRTLNDTESVFPYVLFDNSTMGDGTLADYFNIPSNTLVNEHLNAMLFRAYSKIINEWYVNQNIDTPLSFSDDSGLDTTTNLNLFNVRWNRDIFTSATLTPQKGNPASIPLGQDSPVVGTGISLGLETSSSQRGGLYKSSGGEFSAKTTTEGLTLGTTLPEDGTPLNNSSLLGVSSDPDSSGLLAKTSNLTAVNITDLRRASALQRVSELLQTGGSRYIEFLKNFFHVSNGDLRLQRTQRLGGGSSMVITSEVLQQSAGTESSPLGQMAGHSFASNDNFQGFSRKFTEDGLVLGLLSITPYTMYYQGLPKYFSKSESFDFLNPKLQHIGQDAIKNKEILANHTDSDGSDDSNDNFGFNDRYYEYKYIPDQIHGDFKGNLKYWSLVRDFYDESTHSYVNPNLNSDFIECNPSKRIFAYTSGDTCLMEIHNICYVKRSLDKVPQYILS